jgi:hypothetical protein
MPNPKEEVLASSLSEFFSLPLRLTKVVAAEK